MIFRIIKFAFQNFYRNFWLALVTITILTVALFSITALITLNVIADKSIKSIEEKIDISIYFKKDADIQRILATKMEVSKLPEVKKTTLINKKDALNWFRQKHQNDKAILSSVDILDENPLGDVLVIKAKNTNDYQKILKFLSEKKYDDIIDRRDFDNKDHKEIIAKINAIKNKVRKIGYIIIGIFSFISILIVFNTVRIAIYTHRQEIAIMKLVGATNWFIRAPFLVEEVFYAFLSSMILISVFYPLLNFLEPHLNYFLNYNVDLLNYFKNNFFLIFGSEFLVISFINVFSSFIAMKKYLKV